jgi:signal peptidase II
MSNAAVPSWWWGPYSRQTLIIAVATFAIDQANKWWMLAVYQIQDRGRVTVTPFLDFVFVKNTGISYSMFDQSSYAWQLGLAAFAIVASAALWIWLVRSGTGKLMAWGLGLIIGGALANALDRVLLGGVADFYSLHAFGFYWYVFNIADCAIVAGVGALLYEWLLSSRNDAANPL